MDRLRVAIIDCSPEDQKLSYLGIRWTIGGLVGKKVAEFAHSKGITIVPKIYWPAGKRGSFPRKGSFDAVIVPGSRYNIDEENLARNPWMKGLLKFLKRVIDDPKIPVFGICFGHQAMAVALGGKVQRIPKNYFGEIGYAKVRMTPKYKDDILFKDFPIKFDALFSHFYYVSKPPPGSTVLAYGIMHDMVQAFRYGDSAWGVQFHPDFEGSNIEELVDQRKDWLINSMDLSKVRTVNKVREDHVVLLNFLSHVYDLKFNGSHDGAEQKD